MKNFFTGVFWKLMKICAAQGLLAVLLCSIAIAHDNYAQVLERETSITLHNVSFESALDQIAQQTKIKFTYSPEVIDVTEKISLTAEQKKLREILDELFIPRNIRYTISSDSGTLFLKRYEQPKPELRSHNKEKKIKNITGVVKDEQGLLIAGVNIVIDGTTAGTTTSTNGSYTIAAEENDVLVFSFIGYAPVKERVGSRTVIDVVLTEDIQNLTEVVVNVGYWEVKEKEQTGNVSRITSSEMEKQNVSNPLQAMQGRMAGVYIQQNTGMPGGGLKVQIRGQNSLRDGNDGNPNGNLPLYLIDGVPFTSTPLTSSAISGGIAGGNPLSAINPNDIESIEVLKDADATAIYGSRGANGVVLITTKRGKAGKPKLDINMYQGVGKVAHFMDLLTTDQYLTMRKEGFRNDSSDPDISNAPDLAVWDTTRYTNWQKKFIGGSANITNSNLTFSGGSSTTQFSLAGGYYRETTVFPGSNVYHRGNGRLFVNHRSMDNRLSIESSVNYSISKSDIPSMDFTSLAVTLAPNAPKLYDNNGNLNWENGTWTNPIAVLKRKYLNTTDNFIANAVIGYEVIKNLRIKSSFGFTSMSTAEVGTNPITSFDPQYASLLEGYSNFGNGSVKTWIAEPMIDYNIALGKGSLTALIGSTFQQSTQNNRSIEAYGYTNDGLLENLGAASTILVSFNDASVYKYGAAFARLNYNWQEKYIVNLTGRRDGSSRFGPGNQFANFGAIGAAWLFSNESFLTDNNIISFGKLRASYGSTGSDAIGNYQYLEAFTTTRYPYGGSGGLALSRLANPAYSWETNRKAEIGLDLKFWNNRISLSTSYYQNRSNGQLVGLPLPIMTGQSSVQFNLPAKVQNSGVEFLVFSTNVKKDKFEWSTTLNLTIPSNKLLEFPNLEEFPAYVSRYDVGKSIFTYKAYQYNGVDPQTGLYKIMDRNDDGQLSGPSDYIGLKRNTQLFFGGLGNNIRYGNFQLDFFFQLVKQNGFSYRPYFTYPGGLSNQPEEVMNRWQVEGNSSSTQRFSAVDPVGEVGLAYYYMSASDRNIQDASFVRLKNASLSWQLPSKWLGKTGIKNGRLFVQGQNLLTFTKYVGLDPETQSPLSLPPLRTMAVGFNLSL